jgi:superfamily II DNA or RNA helicase
LTPFGLWRSRLPASISNWFARDLARAALELADAGKVTLRSVEGAKIEAAVADKGGVSCGVEWATGTGPQALRSVCTCGSTGVCEHVVATLETVRRADEAPQPVDPADAEIDLTWLPASDQDAPRTRARSVWPVISSTDGKVLSGALYLDTPRLRGVIRDAESILAMMESTPPDDWDNADRELIRDEAVQEAFGTRVSQRALARALFRLARHPRTRYDDEPGANRHPIELVPFDIDVRGLRLRAVRNGDQFVPALERGNGERFTPNGALIVDGPPAWLVADRTAYLLDDSFDAKRVVAAATAAANAAPPAEPATNGKAPAAKRPSIGTIARVAPFLSAEDRHELGVVDAEAPAALARLRWTEGALIARLAFIDRKSDASAPFSVHGAVAATDGRFVRYAPATARAFAHRFIDAGFVPRGGDSFALHDVERAANFVREVVGDWEDVDVVLDDSLTAVAAGESAIDVSISARPSDVEGERDWFELNVDVFVGDGTALTPKELTALLSSSGRYAEVRGKLFDVEALRMRRTLLSELNDRRRTGMASLVALHDEIHEAFGDVALPEEVEQLRERLRNFEGIPSIEPPEAVGAILRDYQRRGLDFLEYLRSFKFGGILADEMGLGKTLQVISQLLHRKQVDGAAPSLVIAPTSVTHTWENEIARFAPELSTLRLQSGAERATRYAQLEDFDVIITSYALARLDAEQLERFNFRTLILDEAQNAKNPGSQIAKVVRNLRADHRLALTGTPVENSLRDLWSIFAFVEPGLLGSEASFRRRFENPIAEGDEVAANRLRSRLEPFVLRRTKEDVARELPARTEQVLDCDLSPLQRRLYRGIAEAARRDVIAHIDGENGIEGATVHVLAALTRLRQVCAHPGLILPEYIDEPEASGKFDAFMETVEEVLSGGHKVLVFSAFASMLKIMRAAMQKREINYGYLDGSTKDRDRQAEVERFMSADGPPVFLCSLKAGGVGLTLTAADYVILYDPWWNPAVERQAIDRTHRIGQTRPVTAYRMVTAGSVEEKIRALAERKSALSRSVIKAESAIAKSLTKDDLEFLFADPA